LSASPKRKKEKNSMEPEVIELSLTDFIAHKLSKTEFSKEQVEKLARKALDEQKPYEYQIRYTVYRVPTYQLAIYFGLASPFPKEEADEDHVSRDPIGMEDTPPEPKRKIGRPRKT
jgi:hypothetical protein